MPRHPSDSKYQRTIERKLVNHLSRQEKARLRTGEIPVPDGRKIALDGIDQRRRIICEAYAHLGEIKSGQSGKLAKDILRLQLAELTLGGKWDKYICVIEGEPVCKHLQGRSWLSTVIIGYGIKVHQTGLSRKVRDKLGSVQWRQAHGNRSK